MKAAESSRKPRFTRTLILCALIACIPVAVALLKSLPGRGGIVEQGDWEVWTNGSDDQLVVRSDRKGGVLFANRSKKEWSFKHLPQSRITASIPELPEPIEMKAGMLICYDFGSDPVVERSVEVTEADFRRIAQAMKAKSFSYSLESIVEGVLGVPMF